MRTAGIDFDMGRVVICSLPFSGGLDDAVYTEELISRDASVDLAERYKLLYGAARTAWAKHERYTDDDVASVCVEMPGGAQVGRLMGAFGAVCAATPISVAQCSMYASEWKKLLGVSQKKELAHRQFFSTQATSSAWETVLDEHARDALCIAWAWRQVQEGVAA